MELRMSRKERDRLKTMDQLIKGQITQSEAAQRLDLTTRQVRRIQSRYEAQGDHGLVHRLRGRASNRRIPAAVRERAIELLKAKYHDFGPSLASEHLAQDDGIQACPETVRGWMRQAGLWAARRKDRPHRRRRPRRAGFGELVQMDTSSHDWLEGRGPACVLITMIDDATGRKLMRFFPGDSTPTNMALIKLWIERHGRPLALYTDWASHFKQMPKRGQKSALKPTQIERALGELDIRLIAAHSPQAKGRVERSHGTDQDRLIKKMRLAGVRTLEAANLFLEAVYLPQVEERFTVEPAGPDAHRDAQGYDLEAIFSVQEERHVNNDYTIAVDGAAWQIERGGITGGLRGTKITLERRLDGSMWLRWGGRYLSYHRAQTVCRIGSKGRRAAKPAAPAGVGGSALREDSLRSSSLRSDPPTPANPRPKPKRIPSPDHPWRKGTFLLGRKKDISILR